MLVVTFLTTALSNQWWGQDSNLRPVGYEPTELTNCSTPLDDRLSGLSRRLGFESYRCSSTLPSSGVCNIVLSQTNQVFPSFR